MADIYSQEFIYHYKNQPNANLLTEFDYIGKDVNSSCGDEIEVTLKTDESGKIINVGYKSEGCILSAGTMSLLSDYLIDRNISEIKDLSKEDILGLIGLKVTPSREKCVLVGLNALNNATKTS